jgi:hypothetical protein
MIATCCCTQPVLSQLSRRRNPRRLAGEVPMPSGRHHSKVRMHHTRTRCDTIQLGLHTLDTMLHHDKHIDNYYTSDQDVPRQGVAAALWRPQPGSMHLLPRGPSACSAREPQGKHGLRIHCDAGMSALLQPPEVAICVCMHASACGTTCIVPSRTSQRQRLERQQLLPLPSPACATAQIALCTWQRHIPACAAAASVCQPAT